MSWWRKRAKAVPMPRPAVITVKSDPTASVIVNLGRENTVFINPYTGALLGGLSATHNFLHEHRRLAPLAGNRRREPCHRQGYHRRMQPGIFLARCYRSLSLVAAQLKCGLKTSLIFNRRLTGKARDWNWHNVIGFWSSSVLVVLTLTAGHVLSLGQ